jgi:hypothetical protein
MQPTKSQTEIITKENTNNPRVTNTTDIHFTQDETQLLSKGLKYNLHYKQKDLSDTLSPEAETAISYIAIEQKYYRHTVIRNIKQINQENKKKP